MNSDVILNTLPAHLFKIDSAGNILESHFSPHIHNHPLPEQNDSKLSDFLPIEISMLYRNWIKKLDKNNNPISFSYTVEQNSQRHVYTAHGSKQDSTYIFIVQTSSEVFSSSSPDITEILSAVLDTVPISIFWKDTQSVYIGCNHQFAHLAGYESPKQIIGKTDSDMKWKKYANDFYNDDSQVISSGIAKLNREKTFTSTDGNTCTLNISKLALCNKNNQIIGILGVYEDITAEKNNLEEKAKLYEQIRKTQKMEALARLTSGIAHDFNNILASILGYADLTLDSLTKMGNQKELMRYIGEVIDEGEKARDLIAQMLAFARTNSSKYVALNPAPLIKELSKVTQTSLPSNIELSINTDADIPKILIDPSQLHQVILSLFNNARNALDNKGGHISLNIAHITNYQGRCQTCHKNFAGDFVEISVADDGDGIDANMLDKMFEEFFSTKESYKHNGMGLTSAHEIMHQHNGHILIDSIVNYGTNVRLLIPSYTQEEHKPTSTSGKTLQNIGQSSLILIIENDESIARLQSELLQSKGFMTKVFSDAFQALTYFKTEPEKIDCIVIDQNMPSLSGLEFSDKALELRPEIPIILCIGNEKAPPTKSGIKGMLMKPFSSEQLIEQICKLL